MSERAQTVMLCWGLIFMYIYGVVLWGLLDMMPPPTARLTADEVAAFYMENGLGIRLGAIIASWTSAFGVPYAVVIALQLSRQEKGVPAWSVLAFAGGILMTMFLVLPPIFWGVAAFTPERAPEITALMHELGTLTLVTTDQYFIFQMVPIAWIALTRPAGPGNPFPRWLGYFTIWAAMMFELGAIAFVPKKGPFSWNGLFVFWCPLIIYGTWVTVMSVSMLRALAHQRRTAGSA